MNNYEIKKLTSIKELVRVMEFLKDGFSESESFSYKMLSYLIKVNSNKDFFGFYLLDSKIIYGAILTPFQGYYLDGCSTRNEIYSICSWYVHPKFRGIPSLKLQSRAISALKDSIITDYTPGINATKIHKAFGFDSMNSFVYRKRIYPSGVPIEKKYTFQKGDPTWKSEFLFFKNLIKKNLKTNFTKDKILNKCFLKLS